MPIRVHTKVPDKIQSFPQLMYVFSHGTSEPIAYAVAEQENLILLMPPKEFEKYVHDRGDSINGVVLYPGRTNYWGITNNIMKGDGEYIKSLREAGVFITLSSSMVTTSRYEKKTSLPPKLRACTDILSRFKLLAGYYFI